jgi:hypothetical protein
MNLPPQAPPVTRYPAVIPGQQFLTGPGLTASQSFCDHLTGLAQQMCIAAEYGVPT